MQRRTFLYTGSAAMAAYAVNTGCGSAQAGPLAETAQGKIRGLDLNGVSGFYGIRYGESTEGARRFLPAVKPAAWSGEFEAFEFGPEAPQVQPHGEIPEVRDTIRPTAMNEDCLRLNVWTPAVGSGKRPVMFWLHGGGYTSGNGSYWIYDGANLAKRQDVVVVTINHRLNSFGFTYLAHLGGAAEHSANLGMTDCIAALEWVRDNIAAFGGDPSNVTIFGQSGGAGKVSTLLAMPSAQGLFHKAIVQSGSNPVGVKKEDAIKAAETFMAKVGAKTFEDLQAMSMEQLLEANNTTQGLRTSPVVDGVTLPVDPFSPTAPAISANIPLLTGTTETEVTFFPNTPLDPIDNAQLLARVKAAVPRATDAQARNIIEMYRKGRPGISDIDVALIVESDARFRPGVVQQAELKAAQAAPVYLYYFTWRTPVRDGKLKSLHTLEIPFVTANVDNAPSMTGTGEDRHALEERMSAAWAAFARTGNPNHGGLPDWPRFDTATRATMIFDNECKVVNDPNGAEYRALMALRRA